MEALREIFQPLEPHCSAFKRELKSWNTHTHTHTNIYIYNQFYNDIFFLEVFRTTTIGDLK